MPRANLRRANGERSGTGEDIGPTSKPDWQDLESRKESPTTGSDASDSDDTRLPTINEFPEMSEKDDTGSCRPKTGHHHNDARVDSFLNPTAFAHLTSSPVCRVGIIWHCDDPTYRTNLFKANSTSWLHYSPGKQPSPRRAMLVVSSTIHLSIPNVEQRRVIYSHGTWLARCWSTLPLISTLWPI